MNRRIPNLSRVFQAGAYGRPNGGFSPSSLGLDLWLEARSGTYSDAGSTPSVDTGAIQQWNDLSGNTRDMSQGTGGNQPTLQTVSGFPVVRFDGSNDYMQLASELTLSGGVVVIALKSTSASADQMVMQSANGVSGQIRINTGGTGKLSLYTNSTNHISDVVGTAFTSWSVLTYRFVASSAITFYQGQTAYGTVATAAASMTLRWIARPDVVKLSADIAGIFVKSGTLTDQQLTNLINYAAALHP